MEIITKRPEGMSREQYQAQLKLQKLAIEMKKAGTLIVFASEGIKDKLTGKIIGVRRAKNPFRGNVSELIEKNA